jgi:hypothetical protein
MKTIWRKLPTLKSNPPKKQNKKEGKKIPTQNTWNAQYLEKMKN